MQYKILGAKVKKSRGINFKRHDFLDKLTIMIRDNVYVIHVQKWLQIL